MAHFLFDTNFGIAIAPSDAGITLSNLDFTNGWFKIGTNQKSIKALPRNKLATVAKEEILTAIIEMTYFTSLPGSMPTFLVYKQLIGNFIFRMYPVIKLKYIPPKLKAE